jgi:hypothetical protein
MFTYLLVNVSVLGMFVFLLLEVTYWMELEPGYMYDPFKYANLFGFMTAGILTRGLQDDFVV